ncbi:MAG: AraC family transcriptional regulator [Gemmatimonadetes bacterium]|nr:AraC family transcriptional regulator [Gemmatimonadota bacterium]
MMFAADWRQLAELAAIHPGSPALVDTLARGPQAVSGGFGTARACDLSSLPVVFYAPLDRANRHRSSQSGITLEAHLVPGVNDDFDSIDATILRSIDAQRVRRLRERLRRTAHPEVLEIFDHVLDLATGNSAVPELAARLDRTRRSLERRCVLLGIASPETLLSLARIYTVQRLAEWSGQPSGALAHALGFSAPSNYRQLVRTILGYPPSVIQRSGGSDRVAQVILKQLS